jgi:hypothetical protein
LKREVYVLKNHFMPATRLALGVSITK